MSTVALTVGLSTLSPPASADDYLDSPLTASDAPADIGGFYAWHTDDALIAVLTYAPGLRPGDEPVYDAGVLYTVCIDNTGTVVEADDYFDNDNDNVCDIAVEVRFGQNEAGEWGVQVEHLPGEMQPVVGPVETELGASGGSRVWTGVRDNPAFADVDGLVATTSNLIEETDPIDIEFTSFSNGVPTGSVNDSYAGYNAMTIVLEMDLEAALGSGTMIQAWATTARLP